MIELKTKERESNVPDDCPRLKKSTEGKNPPPSLTIKNGVLRTIFYGPYPPPKCPCNEINDYPECVAKFGRCKIE